MTSTGRGLSRGLVGAPLVAGPSGAALGLYGPFPRAHPPDPSAGRARATRRLIARYLLQAEEEAARMRPELGDLRA